MEQGQTLQLELQEDAYRPRRGQFATVIPYIRGISPRRELLAWWLLMDEHRGQRFIFWHEHAAFETIQGDPIAFMAAFRARLAFACYDNKSGEQFGFNWVENIKPAAHAHYGMWYRPKTPRALTRDATFMTTMAVFEHFKALQFIFGLTPWKAALKHGTDLGWKHAATIPDYAPVQDELRPMYVLQLSRP